jgi:hypothetical protein
MMAAFLSLCAVFVVCECLHFRRESILIARLAAKSEADYRRYEENKNKQDTPTPPARRAMARWKEGN